MCQHAIGASSPDHRGTSAPPQKAPEPSFCYNIFSGDARQPPAALDPDDDGPQASMGL